MPASDRGFFEVERLLEGAVGSVFPAAQLIVVDGGREVLARAVGAAELGTVFDLASLTKPLVTTLLAMRLGAKGQLALDQRPRPEITIEQLLTHASGLPAWKLLAPDALHARPGIAGAPDARAGIVEAVRREPLEAEPGTRARYSDLGFILLGDAVERAAGRRLDEAFAAEVAEPLGLGAGFHPDPDACAPTEGDLRGVVHDDNARAMGGVAGHAGLFGTAADVSRLAAALVAAWQGRPGIVEPAIVRRFWTPSTVPGSTWCLGWDRPTPGAGPGPGPGASQAGARWPRDGVGHLGFTGCSLWIDPARARWVVLLSNRVYPTRANERIKQFRPALHDAVVAALDCSAGAA